MKKHVVLMFVVGMLAANIVKGQIDKFNTINLHPVSPTAFQFLKYTEMPVSEYTGIPNISIPFYQINVDEVAIPVQLTYHAQGIRVSQEASWVGLGWDLQMGSIVQEINDKDDYGTYYGGNYIKRRPDFFNSNGDNSPNLLPSYQLKPGNSNGYGWSNPYPISQPQGKQGFAIATDNYVPVGGQFSTLETDLFTSEYYDSEPDIFSANFLGHSVKFILSFLNSPSTSSIVVLTKGYKASKTTSGFSIITPDGTNYFFELKSSITNFTNSNNLEGTYNTGNYEPVSQIYFLTKIVTVKGKTITFDYWQTAEYANYPNASSKLQALSDTSTLFETPTYGGGSYKFVNFDGRSGFPGTTTANSFSCNRETYFYLKSIVFPNGRVDFPVSDRSDITGGKKLDSIIVKNSDDVMVRFCKLNYSYFDTLSSAGNGFNYNGVNIGLEARSSLRLKLNNVNENSGTIHSFIYDSTFLPKKNSYAQDYWGFYNGQLTNTSLIPNPTALNLSALGNNGNNKNANLQYAKARVLTGIKYPTGGKVVFDYELNEFDKSQMIGLPSGSQTVQGAGLRIHTISHFTDSASISPATKAVYNYEGGKLIHPVELAREFLHVVLNQFSVSQTITNYYTVTEISANGVFTSNPLSSVNGVGYTKVTSENVNSSNISKGKIVKEFYNNTAIYNSISNRTLNCYTLFLKSNTLPDNGSDSCITIYDDQNKIIRKVKKTYTVSASDLYYGARIMPYGRLYYGVLYEGNFSTHYMPQSLIGYYPIYDISTLYSSTTTTDYDDNNNSIVTEETFGYDALNQLAVKHNITSDSRDELQFRHAYDDLSIPGNYSLYANNRLTEIVKMVKYKRNLDYSNSRLLANYEKEYMTTGSNIVASQSTIDENPDSNPIPVITTYDQYDSLANLLQYTKAGEINSFLWDYNSEHVVAEVKNASQTNIAYTSFEAGNKGGWTFSGSKTIHPTAPTGTKGYSLSGGSITKSGLSSGIIYIITYWKRDSTSTITVNSASGTLLTTKNGWKLYRHEISGITSITVTGTAYIDELRLYPKGALMTTYTYQPLIGMTSQADPNNRITYYEYDNANRLYVIRDQDRNVIKRICYNYAGQLENCLVAYTNVARSKDFARNDCGIGYVGSTVTYTVPAESYYSTVSQVYADSLAENAVDANGQAFANANGICTEACNPATNCLGDDKKCINGVCETGIKKYIASTYSVRNNNWSCIWQYVFSDCSTAGGGFEIHASSCTISSCP